MQPISVVKGDKKIFIQWFPEAHMWCKIIENNSPEEGQAPVEVSWHKEKPELTDV